jgi:hypothetical protein
MNNKLESNGNQHHRIVAEELRITAKYKLSKIVTD